MEKIKRNAHNLPVLVIYSWKKGQTLRHCDDCGKPLKANMKRKRNLCMNCNGIRLGKKRKV